jgi:sporulation-control protein spo0M
MLRRVKKWLGIEGIKVELILPESVSKKEGHINGTIQFSSMHAQTVASVKLKLIEKYSRGRKKQKLTDEYLLAEKTINELIEVPENELVEMDFSLPFELLESKMDKIQEKNFLVGGIVKAAKKLKAVKSEFRVEVEADVVGTALNPIDNQVFEMK